MTWDDLRSAVFELFTYKKCDVPDCTTCGPILELISHSQIQAFLRSARFRKSELPVESSMCDNFKGWGNFSEEALGIESGVCFPHAIGDAFTFTVHSSISNFFFFGSNPRQ